MRNFREPNNTASIRKEFKNCQKSHLRTKRIATKGEAINHKEILQEIDKISEKTCRWEIRKSRGRAGI